MVLLRARIVLPVTGPPIEDGAVAISGKRIDWVGRWADAPGGRSEAIDLGERVLLPGLINAHCHLDYTSLAGKIPAPRTFTDWIKSLVALKASWTTDDYAKSWAEGAASLLVSGTTTVADVEAVPELLPHAWSLTPLNVLSFRELIHLKEASAFDFFREATQPWVLMPGAQGRIGLSPHAPYTTTLPLLKQSAVLAWAASCLLTTHVSESREEFEMFTERKGALYDWLKAQRNMDDCGGVTPIQHLQRVDFLGPNLLAVHVNYLGEGDATLLAEAGAHVVHCPRSHNYFGHAAFPESSLREAGVNICLGTDSLVTTRVGRTHSAGLDMFAEMQTYRREFPAMPAETVVRMATVNGAAALGRAGHIGELNPGAAADLIAIPYASASEDAWEAVVEHTGKVAASMIGGNWAIEPSG